MEHLYDLNSQKIRKNAGIKSNWEYRQFMQKNGTQIMKADTYEYFKSSGNNPYYSSPAPAPAPVADASQTTSSFPVLYDHRFNTPTPSIVGPDSDLKRAYLKKQQQSVRMIAPTVYLKNECNLK